MTVALFVLGVLIFLFGIGFSIGLHEIGHLIPAKAFGVKVTQYMVGFGPTLWSRHRGETEYGVKAIPLGGYIRMIGMYPPAPGADPTMLRASTTGRFQTLVNDARQQSMEEVTPDAVDRVFYKLPVRKRIVVMLGGPTMNLILAFILFTIVLCGIGIQTATTTVGAVVPCTPTVTNVEGTTNAAGTCTPSTKSPATAGGLLVGDTILSVAGTPVTTWKDEQAAIKAAPAGDVPMVVQRDGREITLTIPMAAIERPVYDPTTGKPTGQTEMRNFVGIAPAAERQTVPFSTVPSYVWELTTASVQKIVTLPVRLWDLMRQTFTSEERDPNGIVGIVGAGRISGEAVALENTPVIDRTALVLGLLAGINLFLFLFNLVPLLPLDGGHVAGAIWESIKRGWAKLRKRPDPGPVDIAKALPLTYAMSIALVLMGAITVVADVIKPITLGG
jgi:membrane-associated protease RseP (regulator of RpoE activity)